MYKKIISLSLLSIMSFSLYSCGVASSATVIGLESSGATGSKGESFELDRSGELNMKVGQEAKLDVKVLYDNHERDTDLKYSSSDESVITIDDKGNFKAIKAGEATLIATPNRDEERSIDTKVIVNK